MAAYRPDVLRSHDANEISANLQGKLPFLRSRNTVELVRTLSNVRVSNISKMAAGNRKWVWNNVYLSWYVLDSNEIPTAIPIRYFIFTFSSRPPLLIYLSPDKRQCLNQSSRVAWDWKHRYSHWSFVAVMCASWDIRYFISTSGSRPPSHFSLTQTSSCTNVRSTMLFVAKAMRIPLKFHIYSICNVRQFI